jgi:putative ABC transport system ATP-binding protein
MTSGTRRTPIEAVDLRFGYGTGQDVLHIPELRVDAGERVFLYGPSGSGKTTLLGLVAGVLSGARGRLSVLGADFLSLRGSDRDGLRGDNIGYIFQMFNLIPYLSVEENITLPARMSAARRARLGSVSAATEARRLCDALGIGALVARRVTELSVGQQQRVAAARALLGSPELIIADEPTSALDADHRSSFLEVLFAQCTERGSSLLFVSHDAALRPLFPRCVSLPEINLAGKEVRA